MSGDMRPYVVRQGDYLAKLAFVHGFDAEVVWQDAKNEEIRGRRGDHNILAPGDIVYLPVKEKVGLPIVKGATNKYKARVPTVHVKMVLRSGGKAWANEPFVIEGLPVQQEGTTDADGTVEFDIPVHSREVRVVMYEQNLAYPVFVGDLDPLKEPSGVRMRLAHLGYYGWYPDHEALDEDDDRAAIAAFQAANGLDSTGVMDDTTWDALGAAHGS